MINEITFEQESFDRLVRSSLDPAAPIVGRRILHVSMSFYNMSTALSIAVQEASGMPEAEGLRHIARVLDRNTADMADTSKPRRRKKKAARKRVKKCVGRALDLG